MKKYKLVYKNYSSDTVKAMNKLSKKGWVLSSLQSLGGNTSILMEKEIKVKAEKVHI